MRVMGAPATPKHHIEATNKNKHQLDSTSTTIPSGLIIESNQQNLAACNRNGDLTLKRIHENGRPMEKRGGGVFEVL